MTENNATKSLNQAFLEQHERQRLNKLCNRTIDLRGKVAGECQAYSFGDKTHYLDDRSYLMAKQLLDRFNGRYTFGVYEAIIKALKLLSANDENIVEKEFEFILNRSKHEVQFIPFDRPLQRKEPRIIFATPVIIHADDVLYNGTTMDITASAISVALKRVSTLEKGDQILVSFPELASDPKLGLLTDIAYSVLTIEHDNLRTRLILLRDRNKNDPITRQFDHWCQQHNSPEYLDLDNELFNLACSYYLRLYCHTLANPNFWLNPHDIQNPIKAFQLAPTAEQTLSPLQKKGKSALSLLPFTEILSEQSDLLLHISSQQIHISRRDDVLQVSALLNSYLGEKTSYLFLLKTQKITIDINDFQHEIALIAQHEPGYADNLEERLNTMSLVTSVTNISCCCDRLEKLRIERTASIAAPWQGRTIIPTPFKYTITRDKTRYLIHTSIQILINNKKIPATTVNVSISGLALNLEGNISLTIGSRITIDFTRWQQQTTAVKLTGLTYIVRNCHFWDDTTHLGLERDITDTAASVNQFFISTIERNKAQLAIDHQDTITSQESEIFGSLLGRYLATIPFYLGMDDDNQRILQAIISTNDAYETSFFLALQNLVTLMSELLNSLSDKSVPSLQFGIYCTQDQLGSWHITTDHEFDTSHEKSLFINRALANKKHYFFHCQLCPITSAWFGQETELNQKLLELRNHSPHKVKQIRSVLQSLFAIGELTDITDIISTHYIKGTSCISQTW